MSLFDELTDALQREYTPEKTLKESPRGYVSVPPPPPPGTPYVFRRFSGSGTVYRKLLTVSCPNLPRIYEVAEQDGQVAVLEEYIRGDTLAFLLAGALLTAGEAKKLLLQLCSGLWVLHSIGAVHRDIKPENVILRGDEAVLIDFDAARIYKSSQERDTRVLGTTGYAAPEQYGISQSDARADIYSLGVLLNIMLTGKHPSQELAPGRMGRIVQKCTMTHPKKRYKTVLHLMEAL
jgi:serine/threonine protein kinase